MPPRPPKRIQQSPRSNQACEDEHQVYMKTVKRPAKILLVTNSPHQSLFFNDHRLSKADLRENSGSQMASWRLTGTTDK